MPLFSIRVLPTVHYIEANTAGEAAGELLAQVSQNPHILLTEVLGTITPTEVIDISEKHDPSMSPASVRFDMTPPPTSANLDDIPF